MNLKPRLGDPDRCGGLEPVGYFCLLNSLPFLLCALFLAAITFGFRDKPDEIVIGGRVPAPIVRSAGQYFLFVVALPGAFASLFLPVVAVRSALYRAHELRLRAYRTAHDKALSQLSSKISEGQWQEAAEAKAQFDLLESVGPESMPSPLWPLPRRLLSLVLAPQVITWAGAAIAWIKYAKF